MTSTTQERVSEHTFFMASGSLAASITTALVFETSAANLLVIHTAMVSLSGCLSIVAIPRTMLPFS